VAAHRFVGVHRVEAGSIEAGQPHVWDDDDAERVFSVFEPRGQRLAAKFSGTCAAAKTLCAPILWASRRSH
jgi:hypothetical protein